MEGDRTYKLDFDKGRARGKCQGKEALRQTIAKTLMTRQSLPVHGNFGLYTADLGQAAEDYLASEVKRRVKEALMADDRIKGVRVISFEREGDRAMIGLEIQSVYGALEAWEGVRL